MAEILIAVAPNTILHKVWPDAGEFAGPLLCEGAAAAGGTLPELAERMRDQAADLWLVASVPKRKLIGVLNTVIHAEPGCLSHLCIYDVAGRDVATWAKDIHRNIKSFAKSRRCAAVVYCGRRDWAPHFPNQFVER